MLQDSRLSVKGFERYVIMCFLFKAMLWEISNTRRYVYFGFRPMKRKKHLHPMIRRNTRKIFCGAKLFVISCMLYEKSNCFEIEHV